MRTKPTVIRRMNYELAKKGRRICEDCGTNLALEKAHFYQQSTGTTFYYQCIRCIRFKENERFHRRYHHDATFRARVIERTAAYHACHRAEHNARQSNYHRRRFARLLAGIRIERKAS